MAHFIEIDNGTQLNLDLVASAAPGENQYGDPVYVLFNADGKKLGETHCDLARLTAPVVAAAAGTTAILLCVRPDDELKRPTAADVCWWRVPVLAWRIQEGVMEDGQAYPVFLASPPNDAAILVEDGKHGLGRFCPGGIDHFTDLAEAQAYFLAFAQRGWDYAENRRQSEKLSAPAPVIPLRLVEPADTDDRG